VNAESTIKQLQELYPGKPIKCLPQEQPSEIICEFDSRDDHPDFSFAMAVIDRSAPHHHRRTTEIYRVVKGELKLYVGNQEYVMYEGQEWTILPGQVHWAEGNETWVEVYCSPGYEPTDHILEEE
jgi:mannose-6-phosphate isomerase-like protein (cupin superfamily)